MGRVGAEALGIVAAGDAGVEFAGDQRHPAQRHGAGRVGRGRQQPGLGVAALQGQQDGEALGHHGPVRQHQRRDAAHRVDAAILGRKLGLALERDRAEFDGGADLGEGHLDRGGAGALVAVEDVGHARRLPRPGRRAPTQKPDAGDQPG